MKTIHCKVIFTFLIRYNLISLDLSLSTLSNIVSTIFNDAVSCSSDMIDLSHSYDMLYSYLRIFHSLIHTNINAQSKQSHTHTDLSVSLSSYIVPYCIFSVVNTLAQEIALERRETWLISFSEGLLQKSYQPWPPTMDPFVSVHNSVFY